MDVEVRLLGAVTVCIGGQVADIGHARQRCVLACLALEANRPVRAEQLLERVWADHPPRHGREALAGYLSRLRQVLAGAGQVAIRRQPEGYVLAVDPMVVDVFRFHDLTARARWCADSGQASKLYGRALALWRGEALAGMDTPWLNQTREWLDAQRLAVQLDYYDLALGQGAHSQLVAVLSQQAQAHPLDERLAGYLMLALYRCGRQADALEHYEQVRTRLAEDLGAEPGTDLQKRYMAILRRDPDFDLPAHIMPDDLPVLVSGFNGQSAEPAELPGFSAAPYRVFGEIVRAHRRRLGLTQEELAERTGINVRGIRNLEAGRIHAPRAGTLRVLADVFGLEGADRDRLFTFMLFEQPPVAISQTPQASASGSGIHPSALVGDGWHTTRFAVVVRLDTPGVETYQDWCIVADRDGLDQITSGLTTPHAATSSTGTAAALMVEVRYGARLVRLEQPLPHRSEFTLALPRPLQAGQRHDCGIIIRLDPGQPARPHYVLTASRPCELFTLRVRFHPDRPPRWVRRVNGEPVRMLDIVAPRTEPLTVDPVGEISTDFERPVMHLAYGAQWQSVDTPTDSKKAEPNIK